MKFFKFSLLWVLAVALIATLPQVGFGWSSKTASDSIGTIDTTVLAEKKFESITGADPVLYRMNLVRQIYFSDTLEYLVTDGSSRCRTYTTGRFQFAPAIDASVSDNSYWRAHRPRYFEVWLWIVPINSNANAAWNHSYCVIPYAQILVSDSLSGVRSGVLGDSTSRFIKSGNYTNPGYGTSGKLYEVQTDTVNKVLYPIKVTDGAYAQLTFSADSLTSGYTKSARNVLVCGYLRYWGY